ncbi:o-succinylbenzoate synthase [Aliterella atlantica]|uniref:o-succinylbenzoate synthase n=1 Tax=Aliterella atlantica TaxID=1827278 RepID=UPI0005D3E502|nr:o-succinylbenzoate synthase [Aliterella atlantica]
MQYCFDFHPYRRRFKPPLQTSYGIWDVREGIIIALTDETGNISKGEIAPISWFGSETLTQALSFCQQLPAKITANEVFSIPDNLPACQFAFESALSVHPSSSNIAYSGLLPAGETVLQQWRVLYDRGYRTLKWKIGVHPIAEELAIFDVLARSLPNYVKLRLDANGGLSYDEANLWLWTCDNLKASSIEIEFIEQPLPVEQFDEMMELGSCYATAIALDESVATFNQLVTCYERGWRDIFVIKPCIAGYPSRLRQFCQERDIDAVFSSVFETDVGRDAALHLAADLSRGERAVGFGISHWFE